MNLKQSGNSHMLWEQVLGEFCKSSFFPKPSNLGEQTIQVPYFLSGGDAFALDLNKCYGRWKVYNYGLLRARRIVENAFGILCARFRVLLQALQLDGVKCIEHSSCLSCIAQLSHDKDRQVSWILELCEKWQITKTCVTLLEIEVSDINQRR